MLTTGVAEASEFSVEVAEVSYSTKESADVFYFSVETVGACTSTTKTSVGIYSEGVFSHTIYTWVQKFETIKNIRFVFKNTLKNSIRS